MQTDEITHQTQPNSATRRFLHTLMVSLIETLEDMLLIRIRNADSCVGNFYLHHFLFTLYTLHYHGHTSTVRSVLECV